MQITSHPRAIVIANINRAKGLSNNTVVGVLPDADGDLWVFPNELDAFRMECSMVHDAAAEIADELWSKPQQAEHIRNYIATFRGAIDFAIERNAGVCIT